MDMRETHDKGRVCVTGAGGYVASWLIKFLLSNGYMVHGTQFQLHDPELQRVIWNSFFYTRNTLINCIIRSTKGDEKNAHLKKLENATENLQLFKTDLLDYQGLCAAIAGCSGVFHVACPVPAGSVPNPEVDMIEPAVVGTQNVLNACLKAKVRRVVVVSSIGAVMVNPLWPKDQAMDEKCWSDREFCKAIENYYCLSKTIAEYEALQYAERGELDVVTVCPSVVIGPMLQPTINASSLLLLALLKEKCLWKLDGNESIEDNNRPLVDVRDVAEALLLVYEKPEAKGRYICTSYAIKIQALVDKLKSLYPNYNYPISFTKVEEKVKLSSEKLQNLGWKNRPLEETISDAIMNYEESGILCRT